MRKRTTCVALMLATLAGTALIATSCTPDTTDPIAKPIDDATVALQKLEDLREKYGWVGKYHTDGLAYIYARLAKNKNAIRSKSDACREAARALKDFHRTARHGEVPSAFVDPSIFEEVCGVPIDANSISRNVSVSSSGTRVRSTELSAAANDYLNQITLAVDGATSRAGLFSSINAIELNAAGTLPESEAGAVEAVASIAFSSADYWEQNLSSWVTLSGVAPVAYSVFVGTAKDPSRSLISPFGFLPPSWWSNAFLRGYLKVLGADVAAGARTAYMSWMAGPIGWDASAASALWASGTMAIGLLF